MEDKKCSIEELKKIILLDKFKQDFKNRSFSGRNLELGRMINCGVCRTRHRSSNACEQKFVTAAPNTRKGVYGALQFKGKRLRPHHSQKNLQLLERTRSLFDKYSDHEPEVAMKLARTEAIRQMAYERHQKATRRRHQQHVSRHINRGLLKGSARP